MESTTPAALLNIDDGQPLPSLTPSMAEQDLRAIVAWVNSKHKSEHTRRAFRTEAQRWLAWLMWAKGGNHTTWLDKATSLDAAAYTTYLAAQKDRPFPLAVLEATALTRQPFLTKALAPASVDRAIDSLRTMYSDMNAMVLEGSLVIARNPFYRFKTSSIISKTSPRKKALNKSERDFIKEALEVMRREESMDEKAPVHYHQVRWIWNALMLSGMRRFELAQGMAGDLRQADDEEGRRYWELTIKGKGNKIASIPVPGEFMKEFAMYREFHGLPPVPAFGPAGEPDKMPLVLPLKGPMRNVNDSLIYRAVKDLMKRASELALSAGDPASAGKLIKSAAHSARHTCVTRIVDVSKDITLAKDMARHESITTTERYRAPSVSRLIGALEQLDT